MRHLYCRNPRLIPFFGIEPPIDNCQGVNQVNPCQRISRRPDIGLFGSGLAVCIARETSVGVEGVAPSSDMEAEWRMGRPACGWSWPWSRPVRRQGGSERKPSLAPEALEQGSGPSIRPPPSVLGDEAGCCRCDKGRQWNPGRYPSDMPVLTFYRVYERVNDFHQPEGPRAHAPFKHALER